MYWLDHLAIQGTLKSLLQHHHSEESIIQCSAFFTVQHSHPYMTTGKTIALTRFNLVGKLMSLLFYMLSRLNVEILGISELKWTGMGEFNSNDHYIYYCEQESLRRNGVAIMANRRL